MDNDREMKLTFEDGHGHPEMIIAYAVFAFSGAFMGFLMGLFLGWMFWA